jgi:aerobic carbon-monoxide dehydrogenase medium subunit
MMPAIELDELVTGAVFPCWPAGHGYAFIEFARRHGDFAIVSAAALLTEDRNGKVTRASVTLGGIAVAPVRASEVERALIGEIIAENRLRDICESLRQLEAIEDIHAPASYRQQLATVLARRALLKAHERVVARAAA